MVQGPTGWRDRRIPSEGEHDTMKTARDSGIHNASFRASAALVPALALFSMASGCAGWSSVGDNRTGLSGAFWNRSDKTTKAAAYDFYADAGAAARPEAAQDTQLAGKETKERRKAATTEEPAPDLVAQEDANKSQGPRGSKKAGKDSRHQHPGHPRAAGKFTYRGRSRGSWRADARLGGPTNWKRGSLGCGVRVHTAA